MRDSSAREALLADLRRTISSDRVLAAVATTPREAFVPAALRERAYENVALPIGAGQTISQPLVVARMLELLDLRGDEAVLDVGTGSGYHAALLARLTRRVYTIERHRELSAVAAQAIAALGIGNVELFVGDGSRGLPDRAPFDAVNVAAAARAEVPAALVAQLAPGGRLVVPVCEDPERPEEQRLVVLTFDGERVTRTVCEPVRFVPLVRSRPERLPPRDGAR